ncbi:hypothetical protein ACPV5O_26635 [Vibrio maritimus]|uniref:hypothetical protein n=1 Tax=Vibrio maritimus TaxID=990268 RepID=UPI004067F1C0
MDVSNKLLKLLLISILGTTLFSNLHASNIDFSDKQLIGNWLCSYKNKGFSAGNVTANLTIERDFSYIMSTKVHQFKNNGISVTYQDSGELILDDGIISFYLNSQQFNASDIKNPEKSSLIDTLKVKTPSQSNSYIKSLSSDELVFGPSNSTQYPNFTCKKR